MVAAPPVREVDDLYAVPPAEFTRARNALVARLRERGEDAKAREVAKLRKPTAIVSAINRVARDASAEVERLITSVERLRRAQTRATDDLPAARTAQRAALARLVECVGDALKNSAAGPSPDLIRRISATALAAAADPATQPAFRRGRLREELGPPGFEALAGLRARHPRVVNAPSKPKAGARERGKDEPSPSRRAAEAQRSQHAALRAATAASKQAKKLEAHAVERQRAAQKSEHAAAHLRAKLEELEERAGRARADADQANREAARLRGLAGGAVIE
jgi:hypothetical protein